MSLTISNGEKRPMTRSHLIIAILIVLSSFAQACDPGYDEPVTCSLVDVEFQVGEEIPDDTCGLCFCSETGAIECYDDTCALDSIDDIDEQTADPSGGWGISERFCCCQTGCPTAEEDSLQHPVCMGFCMSLGGACGQADSDMRLACEGSSPVNGCTCQ
jgi:hypothetical protein